MTRKALHISERRFRNHDADVPVVEDHFRPGGWFTTAKRSIPWRLDSCQREARLCSIGERPNEQECRSHLRILHSLFFVTPHQLYRAWQRVALLNTSRNGRGPNCENHCENSHIFFAVITTLASDEGNCKQPCNRQAFCLTSRERKS